MLHTLKAEKDALLKHEDQDVEYWNLVRFDEGFPLYIMKTAYYLEGQGWQEQPFLASNPQVVVNVLAEVAASKGQEGITAVRAQVFKIRPQYGRMKEIGPAELREDYLWFIEKIRNMAQGDATAEETAVVAAQERAISLSEDLGVMDILEAAGTLDERLGKAALEATMTATPPAAEAPPKLGVDCGYCGATADLSEHYSDCDAPDGSPDALANPST